MKWNLQEEQQGGQYHYTADIQNLNGNSDKKSINIKDNMYRDMHHEYVVPSESEETCSSQTSQTSQTRYTLVTVKSFIFCSSKEKKPLCWVIISWFMVSISGRFVYIHHFVDKYICGLGCP